MSDANGGTHSNVTLRQQEAWRKYRWSELTGLAAIVRFIVVVSAVFFAFMAIWTSIGWVTMNEGMLQVLEVVGSDASIVLLGVCGLVSCILYFIWKYRATANLWLLDAHVAEVRPGWAVGWYFIPLANLWMPYVAMRQLVEPFSGRAGWWWALGIVSSILTNIADRLIERARTLEAIEWGLRLAIVSWAGFAICSVLAFRLVGQITRWQMAEGVRRRADEERLRPADRPVADGSVPPSP
jgi:hypothetical protein